MHSAPVTAVVPEATLPAAAVISSADNFREPQFTDASWRDHETIPFACTTALDQHRLHFQIPKMDQDAFIDMSKLKLALTFKLQSSDTATPAKPGDTEVIAPVCNFTSAMVNSVIIYLNDTPISTSNGLYPWWSYLNTLVTMNDVKKASYAEAFSFMEDTSSQWNQPVAGSPYGCEARRALFGHYEHSAAGELTFKYDDEPVTMFANILSDFSSTALCMVPRVGVRIEVVLNEGSFYIQSGIVKQQQPTAKTKKYELKLINAVCHVPVKQMHAHLSLNLEKLMASSGGVIYHTRRMDCRKITLQANQQSFVTDNIKQSNSSPERIFIFIINGWLIDDPYGLSPFWMTQEVFKSDKAANRAGTRGAMLEDLKLTLNNEALGNCPNPLSANDLRQHQYVHLQEVFGASALPGCVDISQQEYKEGKFVMAFELTRSGRSALAGPSVRQVCKEGALKLELRFSKPLPCSAYLFVLSEYRSAVTVDKNRNVTYSYLERDLHESKKNK